MKRRMRSDEISSVDVLIFPGEEITIVIVTASIERSTLVRSI